MALAEAISKAITLVADSLKAVLSTGAAAVMSNVKNQIEMNYQRMKSF